MQQNRSTYVRKPSKYYRTPIERDAYELRSQQSTTDAVLMVIDDPITYEILRERFRVQ